MRTRSAAVACLVAGYLVLYVAAAQWGVDLATVGSITPWYVPPGLSVALVLFLGWRALPALAVAEAATALVAGDDGAAQVLADVLVTTTAYGAAGLLLRPHLTAAPPLSRISQLWRFVLVAVAGAPLAAALSGTAVEIWADRVAAGDYWEGVRTWWVGDAAGVASMTPALLTAAWWLRTGTRHGPRREPVLMAVSVLAVPALLVAFDGVHLLFLAVIPAVWVALRRGIPGASLAALGTAASSVLALAARSGTVPTTDVQSFLLVAVLLTLFIGAVVTQRERGRSRLAYLALYDDLTGLPNRRRLVEMLTEDFRRRGAGADLAVVVIDLDRFQRITNALGADVGDALVRAVADRLATAAGPDATLARLGRDRFVVALDPGVRGAAAEAARGLLETLRAPFAVSGHEVTVEASAGIATGDGATDPAALLVHADIATTRAKDAGRGRAVVYDAGMERRERDRLKLERDLRGALENGGLRLVFQPIVDTQTNRVMAAEALVRWVDPERGDVEPGAFVPLAEETGLILRIGRWALREACRTAASWPALAHGAAPGVSVNVSTRQLSDPALVAEVADALGATGLPPSRLGIEITETAAVDDELTTLERLSALRALGVRCVLDDFGTGWSSLAWLQRLPVQTLKIDRSFVAGLAHGGRDRAIVDATLQLARALGLQTVAEGVETAAQRAILEELGCDRLQGFFVGRPLGSADLVARLREEAAAPARGR